MSHRIIVVILAIALMLLVPLVQPIMGLEFPHERPALEEKTISIVSQLFGPEYTVKGISSEIYREITDNNITFVTVTLASDDAKFVYDFIYWNDELNAIILVYQRGGSMNWTAQGFAEHYLTVLGRKDLLSQYNVTVKTRVNVDYEEVKYVTYIDTPIKRLSFGLLLVRVTNGVVEYIADLTYAKLPINPEILTPSELVQIADPLLPETLEKYNLTGKKIIDKEVEYYIYLKDPENYSFSIGASVKYFIKNIMKGTYGVQIDIDAITGEITGTSRLGAFGLLPYINPAMISEEPHRRVIMPKPIEATLTPNSEKEMRESEIVVNYHNGGEEAEKITGNSIIEESAMSMTTIYYLVAVVFAVILGFAGWIKNKIFSSA